MIIIDLTYLLDLKPVGGVVCVPGFVDVWSVFLMLKHKT